jgi:hypothetical protein
MRWSALAKNQGLGSGNFRLGKACRRISMPKMLKRGMLFEVIDWDEGQAKLPLGE